MKHLLFIILVLFSTSLLYAQDEVYTVVDTYPGYIDGEKALHDYLSSSIQYPEKALKHKIQGMVYVTCIIEKDGSISNAKILRGIGSGCDEEAKRVILSMPSWTPGYHKGNPVRVQYTLPVRFQIEKQ